MQFREVSAVRAKSLLAFAMAIGCGLVAMVGVQQSLKKQNADPDADKVELFVASTEIPPGQVIDLALLEKKKFLRATAPKEAVTDIAQLERRALIVKVMPGEIIRLDKLGDEGKTGASISIPVGMRVVTVPANMTFAHSGMLKPEDRVDIMVTYKVKENRTEYSETKTFLSYIEVFATDSVRDPNAGADPSGKASILKNISLLVKPDQAQTIAMAKSIGELTINLRNTSDKEQIEVNNLTPDQFRSKILQASIPPDHNDPAKTSQPMGSDAKNPVLDFADDMLGNQKSVSEATTEAWDITIFSKTETKTETVEVERRKDPPKPAQNTATNSNTKKVVNSIIDMFEQPQSETVALKPVHVARPISPSPTNKAGTGNLQARAPKGANADELNRPDQTPPAKSKAAPTSAKAATSQTAATGSTKSKPATTTKTALTNSKK
ncbi:MAG: Flp pilus assembly protein CpaB [Planctomycetaceae bacterium]|nr:Flp pilus assembly protein CpaB [Planctomycetaceae bacterium]